MMAVFRVDASAEMGLGHFMRCLALAQALADENVDVLFICHQQTKDIALSRHDWVWPLIVIPDDISFDDEPNWLAQLVEWQRAAFVVLDGYQFTRQYRQQLHQTVAKIVFFDDNNDSGDLQADLIINGASNATDLGYQQTAPRAIYCLGSEYRILRQEFIQLDSVPWAQRQSLCIMLGGSDPLHLTLPLLAALQAQNAAMPINVMTGAAYAYVDELDTFIRHSPMQIQHLANCQQVADVLVHSRLSISAAGGSQFELLACHTPTLLLVIADNQRNATLQSVQQGWCQMIDADGRQHMLDNMPALATQIMLLWDNEQALNTMHLQAQQYADTQGCTRVIKAIQHMLEAA